MIDLNNEIFNEEGVKIFNKGIAGKVKNVSVRIEPKQISDPDNHPDYKVFVTDNEGNSLNEGFYVSVGNPNNTPEKNKQREHTNISRVLQVAKAILGNDYIFPNLGDTTEEVIHGLFRLMQEHIKDKKVNVFVTYGSKTYPNKKGYMKMRYFGGFIEPADTSDKESKLFAKPNDLLERVVVNNTTPEEKKAETDFFKL